MQYSRWTQETERLNLKLAQASQLQQLKRTQVAQTHLRKKKKTVTKEELGKIPCTSFNQEELNKYHLLL